MRRTYLFTPLLAMLFISHAQASTSSFFRFTETQAIQYELLNSKYLTPDFNIPGNTPIPAALTLQESPAHPPATPVQKTIESSLHSYANATNLLIEEGMSHIGVRYRYGSDSPENGLDCSGLVLYVFRTAIGLDLPRTARSMAKMGTTVSRNNLKPGDLVFFNTMRRAFSHVGIYVGDGQFLHAPAKGGKVRIDSFSSYWTKRFNGARRIIGTETFPDL